MVGRDAEVAAAVPEKVSRVRDILIIDDDPHVCDLLRMYLERDHLRLRWVPEGEAGARQAVADPPDLVILDLMLPDVDGYEVCRWIRAQLDVPIMLLTCRDDSESAVAGLELGADDYVTKPFDPREVEARVRALLRRSARRPPAADPQPRSGAEPGDSRDDIAVGSLAVSRATREVTVAGVPVTLTATEFGVLCLLASHPGVVFTREEILEQVWGPRAENVGRRAVDTQINRLRHRLNARGCADCRLEAVRGTGYRLTMLK